MDNQYEGRDISFETLEKAVNGDYFAIQEVIDRAVQAVHGKAKR
ncbi:hypothetical protein [Parablautia muri]|nr:hypothetical protein [Parablautia muri]